MNRLQQGRKIVEKIKTIDNQLCANDDLGAKRTLLDTIQACKNLLKRMEAKEASVLFQEVDEINEKGLSLSKDIEKFAFSIFGYLKERGYDKAYKCSRNTVMFSENLRHLTEKEVRNLYAGYLDDRQKTVMASGETVWLYFS